MNLNGCLILRAKELKDFDKQGVIDAAQVYQTRGREEDEANVAAIEDHLRELEAERERIETDILEQWKKADPKGYAKAEKVAAKPKAADPLAAIRELYTPGNIILSGYWKTHDKVLEFREGEQGAGSWDVKVVAVKKDGDQWIETEAPRWHMTAPGKSKVVDRVATKEPAQGAEKVSAGFDHFFQTIETKETDTGIAFNSEDRRIGADPPIEESVTIEAAFKGKSAVEAAEWLAENAPERLLPVARKIRDSLKRQQANGMTFEMNIGHRGYDVPEDLLRMRGLTKTHGSFRPNVISVWLNGSDVVGKVGTSYETALHELAHAATMAAIEFAGTKKADGLPIQQHVEDLEAVTNAIIDHINQRFRDAADGKVELTEIEQAIQQRKVNTLSNVDEVLAWTLTNRDVQDYLETIPYRKQTLWSAFVDAVRKVLGMSPQANTALSEVLRVSEAIIDDRTNNLRGLMSDDGLIYRTQQSSDGRTLLLNPGGRYRDDDGGGGPLNSLEDDQRSAVTRALAQESEQPTDTNRGAGWLKIKLRQAQNKGELSAKAVEMVEWLVKQNPALVKYLAVAVENPKVMAEGLDGAAGNYNPFTQVMTLFRGNASDTTAVHEILHHLERMMPAEMQAEIRKEWLRAVTSELQKAQKAGDQKRIDYFEAVLAGDQKKATELLTGLAIGQDYQYLNPSEFWAVRMTNTMAARFEAKSIWARSLQWLKEALEHIKGALGLKSDHPLLKALDELIARGNGEFVSKEMLGSSEVYAAPAQNAGQRPDIPEETRFRKAQRIGQDKLNRFTVIKEWLAENGVKLSEAADVYKAEERLHSKFANKAEDFRTKTVEPLVKKIQKAGFTMGDVAQFLHAQHAEERNIQIAKVNPQKQDGGSGMKTAEARQILATAKPELKRLANELRQITETTKQTLLANGIISQEMADAWDATYKNYVPLKGGPEEGNTQGVGKGLKAVRKLKRALGHEVREEGEWIIENILAYHERALMLVEKNRVGHALIKMALEADREDLITIGKPEKRGVLKPGQATYQVTFHGSIVDAFHNLADAQKFVREEAQKYGRMKSDFGIDKVQADPAVAYMASPMLADNEVNVYVAGHAIRVQINDELLARAYGNMGVEAMNTILKAGRALNTFLSKVYTGYNPEFILTNIVRDFTTGLINVSGEEGAKFAGKAMINYPSMFGQLLKYAVTGKETQWITDYRADGGNTGAAYLSDLERLGKEIQTEYATYKGVTANMKEGDYVNAARAAGRAVFNKTLIWVEHLNQAGENAMRLAIYKAAIESGQSRNKASSLAKNGTVNFNRRGELGQQANALWLFFNAGVQGTAALAHANFKGAHKRQAWALTTAMATLGYLAASAMGGGDDDEYDKLSDYTKTRNLVIKAGDGWIKIPVPYGYGFFWNMGRTAADAARKGEWGKAPWHLASSFVEEFTPFGAAVAGGKPDSAQLLYALPTAVTLVAAPLANRSGMGGPIMPDSPFDRSKPDRERMWRSTKGTMYDGLAGALTEAGIDVSPETLKHFTRSLTGGSGALVDSSISAVALKAQGADLEAKETPFVRKFYTETTIADTRRAYYEAKEKAQDAAEEFARAKKARDYSKMNGIRTEKRELIAMDRYADRLSKQIKAQRDRQDAIRVSDMSVGQKRILLKQMENDEAKIYDRYLDTFKRKVK